MRKAGIGERRSLSASVILEASARLSRSADFSSRLRRLRFSFGGALRRELGLAPQLTEPVVCSKQEPWRLEMFLPALSGGSTF